MGVLLAFSRFWGGGDPLGIEEVPGAKDRMRPLPESSFSPLSDRLTSVAGTPLGTGDSAVDWRRLSMLSAFAPYQSEAYANEALNDALALSESELEKGVREALSDRLKLRCAGPLIGALAEKNPLLVFGMIESCDDPEAFSALVYDGAPGLTRDSGILSSLFVHPLCDPEDRGRLLSCLSERSPVQAWTLLRDNGWSSVDGHAVESIAARFLTTDPAAIGELVKLYSSEQTDEAPGTLPPLSSVAGTAVRDLILDGRIGEVPGFIRRLPENCVAEALASLARYSEFSGTEMEEMTSLTADSNARIAAMSTWAEYHPSAAFNYLNENRDAEPAAAVARSLTTLSYGYPELAAESMAMLSPNDWNASLRGFTAGLVGRGLEDAIGWSDSLPAGQRDAALRMIFSTARDAGAEDAALAAIESLPDKSDARSASIGYAEAWASTEPNSAGNWIVEGGDPVIAEQAIGAVIRSWANIDPAGLVLWLDAIPPDLLPRDILIAKLSSLTIVSPEIAAWVADGPVDNR